MPKPFLGRYGAIGLAAQTAVGTPAAAPTVWLRTRTFLPPIPQRIWTDDEFADGTIFASGSRFQGVQPGSQTLTFEPTLPDIARIAQWMLGTYTAGAAGVPGTILPRSDDFAALAPGTPLTIWQLHPVRNVVMQDAQISNLTLNVSGRATVEASITVNSASQKEYTGAALTPVLPTENVLQFMHFYAYYNAVKLRPKDGNIVIEAPMSVQDGAQGEDEANRIYPVGWSRSGGVSARSRLTIGAHDPMAGIISSYEAGSTAAYRVGFQVSSTAVLELTMPKARVISADPSNGLGLIDLPSEFMASYNGGTPTFSVTKVLPAIT